MDGLQSISVTVAHTNCGYMASTFLKNGKTPSQSQVESGPPSSAQPSYSILVPRTMTIPLMAELPPTQHPIQTNCVRLFISGCGTEVMLYWIPGSLKLRPLPASVTSSDTKKTSGKGRRCQGGITH